MKKIVILIILAAAAGSLSAQSDLSGTAEILFYANIPEGDDYESLVNPDNDTFYNIQDGGFIPSLTMKLDSGDEKSTFSAWFSIDEVSSVAGAVFQRIDLMRLSAGVYLGDKIRIEAGRQSMLTGYGYGWNPIDFANPLKNPADPNAELKGVDAVSLSFYPGMSSSVKVYASLPDDSLVYGLDYSDIKAGTELTFYLPGAETKLAGFWDYDETDGEDAYVPSVGAGFMLDLAGVAVYGEAALREGSRNGFADGVSAVSERKTDWLFSGLAGVEYIFESELSVVAEYFYNGEGLDRSEREDFENSLTGNPGAVDLIGLYTPGYFSRHYILVNLSMPFYDIDTDIALTSMIGADSGALILLPVLGYNFSGSFRGELSYTCMFDISDGDFNEATEQPVNNSFSVSFAYSF